MVSRGSRGRIRVLDIHELVVAGECPPADVADQLEISLAAVDTALAYEEEHPDEMWTLRREQADLRDRLDPNSFSPPEVLE